MSTLAKRGRITGGSIWKLKNSATCSDLIAIKSGREVGRKKSIENIKRNLERWMKNPAFEELRNSPIDLAIVVKMNKYRFKHQDVDNVVKIILDALKKSSKSDHIYLFEDDSQVIRLLVWKMEREEYPYYDTDELIISFRRHDSAEQMEMVSEGGK